jgi:transcriptional regulator with XRE-family HTH domain
MITRKELLKSKEFWLVKLQAALYEQVESYLKENNVSKTDFAKQLGVSKGYVSQILNGDFDHKISKLIELSIAIGKAPVLRLEDLDKCILMDRLGMLDTIQNPPVTINLSIAFNRHVKIEKRDNYSYHHSFNKKRSSRFTAAGLTEFDFSSPSMSLS